MRSVLSLTRSGPFNGRAGKNKQKTDCHQKNVILELSVFISTSHNLIFRCVFHVDIGSSFRRKKHLLQKSLLIFAPRIAATLFPGELLTSKVSSHVAKPARQWRAEFGAPRPLQVQHSAEDHRDEREVREPTTFS